MKLPRKIVVVGMSVLLLLGLAWGLMLPTAPPSRPLRLDFVAFTNGPAGQQLALFRVMNSTRRSVLFYPGTVQVRSGGAFHQVDTVPKAVQIPLLLEADGTNTFSVPRPTEGRVWRVPVSWEFKPTKLDHFREFLYQNQLALQEGRSLPGWRFHMGSWHTDFTPEMQR